MNKAPILLLPGLLLAGCATTVPPVIHYDAEVPPLPEPPPVVEVSRPKPLHRPRMPIRPSM